MATGLEMSPARPNLCLCGVQQLLHNTNDSSQLHRQVILDTACQKWKDYELATTDYQTTKSKAAPKRTTANPKLVEAKPWHRPTSRQGRPCEDTSVGGMPWEYTRYCCNGNFMTCRKCYGPWRWNEDTAAWKSDGHCPKQS